MCSASFSPNGELYVVENDSPNRIFSVNLTNASLTLVGTPSAMMRAIAFSPNGTLYAAFADLFVLSPTDASTVKTIGTISIYPNDTTSTIEIGSMAFGGNTILYGINTNPSTILYKIDTSTGVTSPVTLLASGNLAALVAEQSIAAKSKATASQLYVTPHKSRADLLAIESQLKQEAANR